MAIAGECRDKGYPWEWHGIIHSLRRPSRKFYVAFSSHIIQAIVAGAIAAAWRHDGKGKEHRGDAR